MKRSRFLALTLLGLASASTPWARAAGYPSRPLTLVIPYPSGGSVDVLARAVHVSLGQGLGQPVVIENLGGGSGSIGTSRVARARPDGYTLLLGSVNEVVLAPLINRAVTYKSQDLLPVARIGDSSFVLVGRPGLAARTIDELVELARRNPGTLSYATSGIGSFQHLIMRELQERSGISMLHVPYRGGSTQVADLLGGQIDLMLIAPATMPDAILSGRVRSYGTTGQQREELLKTVPALGESRYFRGMDLSSWLGVFAPANTPLEVQQHLLACVQATLADPGIAQQLRRIGFVPADPSSQAGFAEAVAATQARMQAMVSRMPLEREGAQ